MALVKCIFAVKGVEDDIIRIITHYCTLLPEKVDHFKEPALATLAKFWQDPAVDIQQSARSLILASLARMSKERKTEVIEYWSSFRKTFSLFFLWFKESATDQPTNTY